MKKRTDRGFTLMELMVVIVIVAILAAVAVPLYINYVDDARRTEAKGAIGAIITAEQTYYQVNSKYVSDAFANNGVGDVLNVDLTEATKNWTFNVTATADDAFQVVATNRVKPSMVVTLDYSRTGQPVWTP
jgi:type IV pilus assembly protein PilA